MQLKGEGYEVLREEVRHHLKSRQLPDKKEYTVKDVDSYITAMRDLQDKQLVLDTRQTDATFDSKEDKPIGIAAWGDWHIGGVGVDYEQLEKDGEIISSTDGLYWAGMGDYKDNYQTFGHAGAQYEQIIQPGMQDKVVERTVEKYGENNILFIKGCHDDWDNRNSNKDFISTLCKKTGSFNLWHGGNLTVNVGSQSYLFRLRHKFPFESGLNVENSMRRMFDIKGEFDVAGSAHLHNPFFIQRQLGGRERILFRSGSYKYLDEHGQKIAGYKGIVGIPVVILWPDKHDMAVMYLDKAVEYLKSARG